MGYTTEFDGRMKICGQVPNLATEEFEDASLDDFEGFLNGNYFNKEIDIEKTKKMTTGDYKPMPFLVNPSEFIVDDLTPVGLLIMINFMNRTRRMKRNVSILDERGDYFGKEGAYFFYDEMLRNFGQVHDETVKLDNGGDYNKPSSLQPGLWCQWILTEEDKTDENGNDVIDIYLKWDGGEKFYHYSEWLKLINNLLKTKGMFLNGEISYQGEDGDDSGILVINNGVYF